MKRQMWSILAASAIVTAPLWMTPAYAKTQETMSDTQIYVDGKLTSMPKWFAHDNTAYMPVYYVMQALKDALDVQSHWNGKRWDLIVPTSSTVDLSNVSPGTGNVGIYINGTLVQRVNSITRVDPASQKATTYMPIWYVMQVLKRVHVLSVWDSGGWNMYTNISPEELQAYSKAHPGWKIGYAAAVTSFADDKPSLIVENQPRANPYEPVTITVITPTLQVHDITTEADYPQYIQAVPQSIGSWVAAYTGSGAHLDKLYLLQNQSGTPSVLKEFDGDDGVLAWVQDGATQVLVSNRTYNWDLIGPDGQKDDSAINDVYRYSGEGFEKVASYESGVFEDHPQFQTDPSADTAALLTALVRDVNFGESAANIIAGWKSSLYATSFINDMQHADLSFLHKASFTQSLVISTVQKTEQQVVYRCTIASHMLYVTLQNNAKWQFTGLSVDVNPVSATSPAR